MKALYHRQISFGDGRIDREGGVGGRETVIDIAPVAITQAGLGDRQQCPGLRVIGIDLHRAAADAHHALFAADVAVVARDPILPREKIEVVRFDVGRTALFERLLLFGQQLDLQGPDDGF